MIIIQNNQHKKILSTLSSQSLLSCISSDSWFESNLTMIKFFSGREDHHRGEVWPQLSQLHHRHDVARRPGTCHLGDCHHQYHQFHRQHCHHAHCHALEAFRNFFGNFYFLSRDPWLCLEPTASGLTRVTLARTTAITLASCSPSSSSSSAG